MGRFFKFLAGVMIGSVLGSAAVILLTPYKGNELRGRLTASVAQFVNEVQSAAAEKRVELEKELTDLKHNIVIS